MKNIFLFMNVQLLNKKDGIMICYVYAKFKGNKNFKAFDIKNGREAGNDFTK